MSAKFSGNAATSASFARASRSNRQASARFRATSAPVVIWMAATTVIV